MLDFFGTFALFHYPQLKLLKARVLVTLIFPLANCPSGRYNNKTAGNCTKCPKGFYQDEEKQTACKKCPAGSTTMSEGSITVTACKGITAL